MTKEDDPKRIALLAGGATLLAFAVRVAARRRTRISFTGRSVVIAGGSRGLGLVMARMLADEGARLALLARDAGELARAEDELLGRGTEVMVLTCDIRSQQQVQEALGQVVRQYGRLDVLINNAGIIQVGPIEHMQVRDYEDALGTHFWGPLYAIEAAVPGMRAQGGGRIVNITSVGGEVAVPHLAPYVASKFALVGLSDALRAELHKDNIQVTTVIPGLMRTGSHQMAMFKGRHRKEFTWFSVVSALPVTSISAEGAARQILDACRYGESYRVITPQARLMVMANAVFPGLMAAVMKLINLVMPRPEPRWGEVVKMGYESYSDLSPSRLTALADRAAAENNELGGGV